MLWIAVVLVVILLLVVVYDLNQRSHAILRNFPVIGHFRYWIEAIGPELRQYIVTNNDEERPFSRDQRRWIYSTAKRMNSYFGFGTDNDLETSPNYLIIKHATLRPDFGEGEAGAEGYGCAPQYQLPCGKVMGASRGRAKAFRPDSIINVGAMSFGSLSAPAIRALNEGCAQAGCLHNTGEGGISEYHRHGAGIVWQIGTGYFGCRDESGRFSLERFIDNATSPNVRAIEIKLSQGAKPGRGGVLPAAKITSEISRIRHIPMGRDCISPPYHTAFRNVDELLDFAERLSEESGGLPVGIKSAVGELGFWEELAGEMQKGTRGLDFIAIDGGEGGTGAAPLVFSDHVALPFKVGFSRVFQVFAERGLHEDVVFVGSGRLGLPDRALFSFGMGCDLINVAREAMLAIGCIQAQRCHTGHCPTGVATQNAWLQRGLDPTDKSVRLASYMLSLRKELLDLARSCGVAHPALVSARHFEIVDDAYGSRSPLEVFGYGQDWGVPGEERAREIEELMCPPRNEKPAYVSAGEPARA